jgi:hypothetical protein
MNNFYYPKFFSNEEYQTIPLDNQTIPLDNQNNTIPIYADTVYAKNNIVEPVYISTNNVNNTFDKDECVTINSTMDDMYERNDTVDNIDDKTVMICDYNVPKWVVKLSMLLFIGLLVILEFIGVFALHWLPIWTIILPIIISLIMYVIIITSYQEYF